MITILHLRVSFFKNNIKIPVLNVSSNEHISTFFVDQLWKYNSATLRLENKNGRWRYLDEFWIQVPEEEDSTVETKYKNLVLNETTNEVVLQNRTPVDQGYMWLRGKTIDEYFTLKDSKNPTHLLTANSSTSLIIESKKATYYREPQMQNSAFDSAQTGLK